MSLINRDSGVNEKGRDCAHVRPFQLANRKPSNCIESRYVTFISQFYGEILQFKVLYMIALQLLLNRYEILENTLVSLFVF